MAYISGYEVLPSLDETRRDIWDAEDLLGSLPADTADEAIALWIEGYEAGRKNGERLGRYKLQYELRMLLGEAR